MQFAEMLKLSGRFRGKPAARAQWRLECAIHNLLKLHRAGGLAILNTS